MMVDTDYEDRYIITRLNMSELWTMDTTISALLAREKFTIHHNPNMVIFTIYFIAVTIVWTLAMVMMATVHKSHRSPGINRIG